MWSERERTLDLHVAPTLVQTVYFKLACALAGLLLLWFGYRLRLRHALRRLQLRFDERVAERERIARDLHGTLLQSVHGLALTLLSGDAHVQRALAAGATGYLVKTALCEDVAARGPVRPQAAAALPPS